jgi:hypothetical protein
VVGDTWKLTSLFEFFFKSHGLQHIQMLKHLSSNKNVWIVINFKVNISFNQMEVE